MEVLAGQFTLVTESKLNLDADTAELSRKILERCRTAIVDTCGSSEGQQDEGSKRLWFACILFIAKGLRQSSKPANSAFSPPSVTLTQILAAFEVSLTDFLKELPVAIKRAEPNLALLFGDDPPLERRLKLQEVTTSCMYTTILAKKFKEIFRSYFTLPLTGTPEETSTLRLGWLLFVVAKAKLLPPFPDLVSSFNLLVCVMNVLLAHVPAASRKIDVTNEVKFPVRTKTGATDTLQSIAVVTKANLPAVTALMASLDAFLREKMVVPVNTVVHPEAEQIYTSCSYFEGLVTHDELRDAVTEALDEDYETIYAMASENDERPFLDNKDAEPSAAPREHSGAATPPSMTKCQVTTPGGAGTPGTSALRLLPSPLRRGPGAMLRSPSPVSNRQHGGFPACGTPVSVAMEATAWLRDMAANTPEQPSADLRQYFEVCDPDMGADVAARTAALADAVFPSSPPSAAPSYFMLHDSMYTERKQEGVMLYYRVLEAMLKAEEGRTGKTNFTTLLTSNSFHKCLLACAFELVVASYRMVTLAFPAVLERLQLKAFDMSKLIGSFVHHEPSLPKELKKHLFSIEEKILEALAWERGSSLFPLLVLTRSPPQSPPHSPPHSPPEAGNAEQEAGGSGGKATPTKRHRDGTPTNTPPKERKESTGPSTPLLSPVKASSEAPASPKRLGIVMPGSALLSPHRCSSASAFSTFISPMRQPAGREFPALAVMPSGPLPHAFGRPAAYVGLPERPGYAILSEFLRKVLKLSEMRLRDLCGRINFAPLEADDILTQVYTIVEHVVYEHTSLLYNRHLDQVLLCAMYGVCKVNQLSQVSFKEIIQHYRRQPQAKSDIFRTVIIHQSEPDLQVQKTGDVIEFYNAVFIPTIKAFLLKVGTKQAPLTKPPGLGTTFLVSPRATPRMADMAGMSGFATPPPSNRSLSLPAFGDARSPARKVATHKKVFVSPLRQQPKESLAGPSMTPRTRSLYAFVGESAHQYQSPSKDLGYINDRINGRAGPRMGVFGGALPGSGSAFTSGSFTSGGTDRSDGDANGSQTSEPSSSGLIGRQGSGSDANGAGPARHGADAQAMAEIEQPGTNTKANGPPSSEHAASPARSPRRLQTPAEGGADGRESPMTTRSGRNVKRQCPAGAAC
ncbi:hypothetical protein WJX72_009183 [[Myrmecia] bisecta]|uniref:Uncharacterized protein n=1 Tax=[Myrmecia] bisecta TaxID=41462 RepID=A0AAW1Q5B3_9CHLO